MSDVPDSSAINDGDARRFAAFISYSHADAADAARLQRRLEKYRLPKRIVDARNNAHSLGKIFRDREDLAAAASLSAAIRDAIAQAEALIVMCSPDAATSPWVAAEIDLFRSLHPDRPILAVLLSGEPSISFPPALTEGGLEPLAADMRPQGDGPQLGFLKIVAGIAAVPLDALIQRDAQRRIRRVTAITVGALAAVLAMGVMTTLALSARNEAARQRAEAEGLVEYMLTDLREKLKAVGRLEIMDAVNARAMEHYRRQGNLAALPADSLERRARILHAMGEDFERKGDLTNALDKFRQAHAATANLLSREPDNPERMFAHAQSEYWVGYGAWQQTDVKTAGKYWQGYLRQAEALAKVEPGTVRSLMELGYAHGNMCELRMNKNANVKAGLAHCKKAIDFERRAVELEPGDAKNAMQLANRLGWMADALVTVGRLDEAFDHRLAEQVIIDSLLKKDPKNAELRSRATWPQIGLGKIEANRGRTQQAVDILTGALTRTEALAREFPDDTHMVQVQVRINLYLAQTRRDAGFGDWHLYRDRAVTLIEKAGQSHDTVNVARMAAMLSKFEGEGK